MTLVLGAVGPRHAVLVADRRVTRDGLLLDDEYNKVTVLFCEDAKFGVAFTGMARIGQTPTHEWIASTLARLTEDQPKSADLLVALSAALSTAVAEHSGEDKRLALMLVGFVYWESTPSGRIYEITNFAAGGKGATNFETFSFSVGETAVAHAIGDTSHLHQSTLPTFCSLVTGQLTRSDLVRYAVFQLRRTAKTAGARSTIGESCNAITLTAPVNTVVTSTYHTTKHSPAAYGANVVIAQGLLSTGEMVSGPGVVSGKEIQKKDSCWCGSGVAYSKCHLRKFGATNLFHPAWRMPLASFIKLQRELTWPSGNVFCVSSSYV